MPILDFTSALYLGFRHASGSLLHWTRLTTGVPAALGEPEAAVEAAQRLAALQGCEQAVLAPSTLHLFWDLLGMLGDQQAALYVEQGIYPIARWGVERAAGLGAVVRHFPHHDPRALEACISSSPPGRRVVVVADGICARCGTPAPMEKYLALLRQVGGLLVLDDTQALGLLGNSPSLETPYGLGGGGSLRFAGVSGTGAVGKDVLLISSLAKAFGAPLAALSGSRSEVQRFTAGSETRLHCSPPSLANIQAALRALEINERTGDWLRRRLSNNIRAFQSGAGRIDLQVKGGWFPVQTIQQAWKFDPQRIYHRLLEQGVRGLLLQGEQDGEIELSFIITARHTRAQIERLVWLLGGALNWEKRFSPGRFIKDRAKEANSMNHNQISFEAEPFEFEYERSEFDGELEEEYAQRRGWRRPTRSTRPTRPGYARRPQQRRPIRRQISGYPTRPSRPRPLPPRPARPYRRRPLRPRRIPRPGITVIRDYPVGEPSASGTEYVRWVQSSLNQILDLNLPLDGVMGVETRSAVRSFQEKQGLPADGVVGPDTEQALKRARSGQDSAGASDGRGNAGSNGNGQAPGPGPSPAEEPAGPEGEGIFDTVKDLFTANRIIDLTAKADKSNRKGLRNPKSVYALVLHQMACCFKRKDPLKSYLRTKSHFVILPDGKILQLHPISALLWASHGFNKGSVAVEFAGNFPNTKGKWWKGDTYGRNRVTPDQIEAGRYLVRYLIRTMGLTHILAHRQSSAMRENDPGPDIWNQVGQWAIDNHGLKDGGPGFKIGGGNPIPALWRTWGQVKPQPEIAGEIDPESPEHARWLQQALNRALGMHLRTGEARGPMGRSALRSLQRRHGLPVDGELTEEVEELLFAAGAPPHRHPAAP